MKTILIVLGVINLAFVAGNIIASHVTWVTAFSVVASLISFGVAYTLERQHE